jgi:hypothetical protein
MSDGDGYRHTRALIEHDQIDWIGDGVLCQLVTIELIDEFDALEPAVCQRPEREARAGLPPVGVRRAGAAPDPRRAAAMSLTAIPSKVTAAHLDRTAYLYVRQSTLRQVLENTESAERQYALRQRAVALGTPLEQVGLHVGRSLI